MSITNQLEAERRIINAATAGPWREDECDPSPLASIVSTAIDRPWGWVEVAKSIGADAEFIALARTALPLRNAQVAAVLAECAEMHSSARLLDALGVEPDKAKALRTHADLIRRAIEEAGG